MNKTQGKKRGTGDAPGRAGLHGRFPPLQEAGALRLGRSPHCCDLGTVAGAAAGCGWTEVPSWNRVLRGRELKLSARCGMEWAVQLGHPACMQS